MIVKVRKGNRGNVRPTTTHADKKREMKAGKTKHKRMRYE